MQRKAVLSLLAFVASFASISATSNRPPAFGDSLPGLTPLFGLGLVDAVPDGDFFLIAAQEAQHNDGTAGRVHMVPDLVHGGTAVGKFGWKAQVPSLKQFAGDAYLNEMGISNPLFQAENCPSGDCQYLEDHNPAPGLNYDGEGAGKLADFMTMRDAPPRAPVRGRADAGEKV